MASAVAVLRVRVCGRHHRPRLPAVPLVAFLLALVVIWFAVAGLLAKLQVEQARGVLLGQQVVMLNVALAQVGAHPPPARTIYMRVGADVDSIVVYPHQPGRPRHRH